MGFTKLDEGILQSSVMATDPVTFKVWIALLAACESDGIARVAPNFLAAVCHITRDQLAQAIADLEGPDADSRSLERDGRRIERCSGGWLVLNYSRFRDQGLRAAETERKRRYREGGALPPTEGYVYFARFADRIKIGFSRNPSARVAELRIAAPDIVLAGSFRGTEDDEAALHAKFSGLSIGGEWFKAEESLLHEIVVRTTSVRSPDYSASASASPSASGGEKGSGGEGSQDSPPRQPFPGERAEQAIKDQTRSLQLKLGALIGRLAEHPRSTRMVPDWSREVTSYERPDGTKVRGSPDWRTIFSIDRLEKSIADAEWWFNKLEAEEVPAHGTR